MGDFTNTPAGTRASTAACNDLEAFRTGFYGCLTGWSDALFELCDAALCAPAPVTSVPSGAAYRHYWELAVLYGVRAKLRSGDVWVPGSRRYTDPTTMLIPVETWVAQRDDFCAVTGTEADPTRQLQRLGTELHAAVADLERVLADPVSEGLARIGEDGDLIASPLPAEQVPAEADALAQAVAARLPQIHLPALLIEVDRDTRFSEAFTHAGGAQPRNPDLIRNLYASVLAYACNLGYAGMADASGISEDTL